MEDVPVLETQRGTQAEAFNERALREDLQDEMQQGLKESSQSLLSEIEAKMKKQGKDFREYQRLIQSMELLVEEHVKAQALR